ncbi:LOW QUALITY PROTEIN: hypothetical protein RJ640_015093 [Escallonia rubra]|uniref:Tify domain-containing protein n=1 Tax=Escallonia rubra TaxID=112253 RepID=A0AA88QNM6_9ASTE|nr:LOW QUALITY PROTEIN: hypothetical protein RJ640_015093 [Escallonia rubra]
MDDPWQGKCGSNLQPRTMSLASSSKFQLHPQESRNQVSAFRTPEAHSHKNGLANQELHGANEILILVKWKSEEDSGCGDDFAVAGSDDEDDSLSPFVPSKIVSKEQPDFIGLGVSQSRLKSDMVLDAGYQFYPMFMQGPSPSVNGMSLEPTFPCTSNISSYNPSHAELGSSFLSLLSGPPSVLQFDLERSSYPRPYISTNNSPISCSSAIVSAAGHEVSCAPTRLLSPNPDKGNLDIGFHHRPVVSSKAVENQFCGTASCLHDFRQARNINFQIPIHQSFSDNDYVNRLHSRKGEWLAGPSPAQVVKHHRMNIQTTNKVVLETNSSGPRKLSPFTSGSPRVYCLGASGDLLLSNTGLLGVVCSCHSLHMSISKFSEHSGLRDVNPGIGIHMDSGETIAQWRKVYFHKFGIRVQEDHSGWDWPEGFSAAAGSVTCSATVPKMSRISEVSNFSDPAGLSLASGQARNNIVCSNDAYTDLRSANEVLHNEKQRNAADSWNFLNGFVGTSDNYVNTLANKQIVECPMSECSTMSKLVGLRGPDNDSQSISTYIGSISKSGNSYVSLSNLQNLKTPSKDSDIFRYNNMKNGDIFDGATISSNIELRLGQPSQQSHTLGNSNLPAFGSHLIGIHDHPQKSQVPEEPIYNSTFKN